MKEPCKGSDQRPAPFVLEEPTSIGNIRFPSGSVIGLDERGRLWRCRLAKKTRVMGIPCAAGEIGFHAAGGGLAVCTLAEDCDLSGVTCKAGELLLLHPQGTLFRGIVVRNMQRQGFPLLAGDELCLHENGRISSVFIRATTWAGSMCFAAQTRLWLRPDGRPWAGTLVARDKGEGNGIVVVCT